MKIKHKINKAIEQKREDKIYFFFVIIFFV